MIMTCLRYNDNDILYDNNDNDNDMIMMIMIMLMTYLR